MRFLSLLLGLVLSTAGPARALPILNEVFYDAAGPDASSAFTEILGEPGTVLDGWSLVGINGADREIYRQLDLSGAVVPDDGLLLIGTAHAAPELALELDFIANVDWQNGPDAVQLWSSTGLMVDALQYGDAGAGNAGEGVPAPDVLPGWALTRRDGADSDDNAADFVTAPPSPGRGWRPVAEPRSSWLLACSGFLSLMSARVGRGRRRCPPCPE